MTIEEAIKRIKQHRSEAEYCLRLTQVLSTIENELLDIRAFTMAIEALECAPPKGHWIFDTEDGYYKCSECGSLAEIDSVTNDYWRSNFCPNCGADMRGESN